MKIRNILGRAALAAMLYGQIALADGLAGGGPVGGETDSTAAEIARLRSAISEYERTHGPISQGGVAAAPPLYPFFPLGANLDHDAYVLNFNDLIVGCCNGLLDYACAGITYDGHDGSDTPLRSFLEQEIGVPVLALADGVVVYAHDGEFDMNTNPQGQLGNDIVLDLGNGRTVHYSHLKNGSVAVAAGEWVRAGRQIAMAASSGNSTRPHLHLGSFNDAFVQYEPFAGACRPGPSAWEHEPSLDLTPRLLDCAPTYIDPATNGGLPHDPTRSVQIALTDAQFHFWTIVENLPVNAEWRARFERPNGTIAYDLTDPFNNADFYRGAWFYWSFGTGVFENTPGTWTFLLDFNGQRMVDAPFEVVAVRDPGFNRPPAPISAELDPPQPKTNQAVFCRVQTSTLLDDPDYDLVRYEYVWTVNGVEVRHNTFAGQADALPAYSAGAGDLILCTVTPSDGRGGFAPPASASVRASFAPPLIEAAVPATIRNAEYYVPNGTSYGNVFDPSELCFGRDNAGYSQIGLEFALPVPRGADILSARIDFVATWNANGDPVCQILAYDVADAPPFDNSSNLPLTSFAPVTSSFVPWNPPAMVGEQWYSTPDLTPLVQQVIDRGDWNAGQFLGLILDGSPTAPEAWQCMRFTGSGAPARLILTYATVCAPCDSNCDGSVNTFDIQSFLDLLIAAGAGGCSACAADANVDGTVNQFDINGFVDCLIP